MFFFEKRDCASDVFLFFLAFNFSVFPSIFTGVIFHKFFTYSKKFKFFNLDLFHVKYIIYKTRTKKSHMTTCKLYEKANLYFFFFAISKNLFILSTPYLDKPERKRDSL